AELPEAVVAPRGDPGQVERGGAGAAQVLPALQEVADDAGIELGTFVAIVREAGDEERAVEGRGLRDAHRLAVERGSLAGDGQEELVAERVVDAAGDRLAALDGRDRDAGDREAVREVQRPVQRIDDPKIIGAGALLPAFLGEEVVIGKPAADRAQNGALGREVHLSDDVGPTFVFIADPRVAEAAAQVRSAGPQRLDEGPAQRFARDRAHRPFLNSGASAWASPSTV